MATKSKKTVKKTASKAPTQVKLSARDKFGFPKSINVTAEDIKNGKQGDPCKCAIALALKREFGINAKSVYVESECCEVTIDVPVTIFGKTQVFKNETLSVELPYDAEDFIEAFDEDRDSVKPTKFSVYGVNLDQANFDIYDVFQS